jgi:hypothetical protein
MKSAERHKLETNWLAGHLNIWIEQLRPYASTIAGVLVSVVVILLLWNMFAGSQSSRHNEAWTAYHDIIGSPIYSTAVAEQQLTQLSQSAEEFQGTAMQEWATLSWADGLVWQASGNILVNRAAALESLNRATSAYSSILGSSNNSELVDRAHLGLARIHELRNEPEKAIEEYGLVKGNFAAIAKQRIEVMNNEKTKASLEWLAKAEVARTPPPAGSGTPGERPLFDVPDFSLPDAAAGATPAGATGATETGVLGTGDLFEGLKGPGEGGTPDRYREGETPAGTPPVGDEPSKETDASAHNPAAPGAQPEAPAQTPGGGSDK